MLGKLFGVLFLAGIAALPQNVLAQDRRSRIDVIHYTIDAEVNPKTQLLNARVAVRFTPLDDRVASATFELNNALNVSKVTDDKGRQFSPVRTQSDFTVRVNFPEPLAKDVPVTLTFSYDGHLTGSEDSPVYGIKFAGIHDDFAYLLYPSRWFPVSGYATDRFTADINVTVPTGFRAVGSGSDSNHPSADKVVYSFQFQKPSFPGSIAVVKANPTKVAADGLTTSVYFRGAEANMSNPYGAETAKMVNHFTGLFGIAPYANLTLVETEAGGPNGYSAPGLVFLSPRGIGREVNARVLANQVARQWWETLLSPATRNHLWLENGFASYSEALWAEQNGGAAALEAQMKAASVEALTIENVPVLQAARMEDYSPELFALTSSKGAEVLNMLRYVLGDKTFFATLKQFAQEYGWKSVITEDFRKIAENVSQQDLKWFFIEWIESNGAPEFKLEYTVFRTQKGFRVQGKIAQDLDTFRMPVDLRIETEGNPEVKRIEVAGTSSEFSIDTFGKPKSVAVDPNSRVLHYSNPIRISVAIRRGEQFAEISEFTEALKEYQKALETSKNNSLAHYRIAEIYFLQNNYQSAANEFRETLNGDLDPKWVEVWAHINLGKIFDITGQRERAVNEYTQAQRTRDNTQGAQDEVARYIRTPYERKKSDGV